MPAMLKSGSLAGLLGDPLLSGPQGDSQMVCLANRAAGWPRDSPAAFGAAEDGYSWLLGSAVVGLLPVGVA